MTNIDQNDSSNFSEYLCEYKHGNSKWGFKIFATSYEDAQERIKSIGINGELKGEVFLTIDASKPIDHEENDKIVLAKQKRNLNRLFDQS